MIQQVTGKNRINVYRFWCKQDKCKNLWEMCMYKVSENTGSKYTVGNHTATCAL